ncbi:pyruvate ferredoxin oxidoreductase [Candidatus Bathyarchaeota archaeon]|nr:pyruvate ferredoxin oxidoreductase [Candidatus Bathyarchaeota archaeon]
MNKFEVMVGNKAVAYAAKLARVQYVSAFPITPQTTIVQYLADMIASGELDADYVTMEGELSCQSSAMTAATTVRSFTATSGPGLLYMHHPMHMTTWARLPLVMAVIHRSTKGMQPDQMDMMSQRDTGWLMLECQNSQELLDTGIMSFKIAEDKRVRLPLIFAGDGYILSYTSEPVELPPQEEVDAFLPPYDRPYPMFPEEAEKAMALMSEMWNPFVDPQKVWKDQQDAAMAAKTVIKEVNTEFERWFGRSYGNGLVEEYKCDGVEAVIVSMGTIASTAKTAIDQMQADGEKIGLVAIKSFKPFPDEEFQRIAGYAKAMGVIDRNVSTGTRGGITFTELRHALFDVDERPATLNFHAGMRGKEVRVTDIKRMAEKTLKAARGEKVSPQVEWA